jgi:hypothetical protein
VLGCGLQTNTHTYTHTNNQTGKKHKLNSRSALRLLLLTTTTTTTIIVEQKRVCMVFFFFLKSVLSVLFFSLLTWVSHRTFLFLVYNSRFGGFCLFVSSAAHRITAVPSTSVLCCLATTCGSQQPPQNNRNQMKTPI